MGVPIPLLPIGTRVQVRRGTFPLEGGMDGRTGHVTEASEYGPHRYGVTLDGEGGVRHFRPEELVAIEAPAITPDREAAKRRRALP